MLSNNTGLKQSLEKEFKFRLNDNQSKDIIRLFHEISSRETLSYNEILFALKENPIISNSSGKNIFQNIKRHLLTIRFPITSRSTEIDQGKVYLAKIKKELISPHPKNQLFVPSKIFIEQSAKNSSLSNTFIKKFPQAEISYIKNCLEFSKEKRFKLKDLKNPWVFIVQENWDFVKPCPCTKDHIGCNYWIFNLGFGCPYDCSYCFLQQYSNFPGIVLPANLDDFFISFDEFHKKLKHPIRIGTGEFCDSLALDHITGYSSKLINYFKNKNVIFELKTKSNNIDNILKLKGRNNIVLSWSLNPPSIIKTEELLTATLDQRIEAASKVQAKGFSIGFHFDPVVYSDNWTELYKQTIDRLYSKLKAPFAWISIGSLRGTRKLKDSSEARFPKNNIFYGELLLGKDKKLRYPKFLRKQIYSKMKEMIRQHDTTTPIYLCMEDAECWESIDKTLDSSLKVEKYLLK